MINRLFFLIFFMIFSTLGWTTAPQALIIDSDRQFDFAQELFNTRQYRRSAEEYQRFAFFFPEDSRCRSALFKAGQAFLLAKDPDLAIKRFKLFTKQDHLDALAVESYFMLVECHLQMRAATHAIVELNNLIALSDDIDVRDRAYYRLGWLHIDQIDWPAAQRAFSKISPAQRSRYRIDDLERDLSSAPQLPTRNPALAGTLSIIPGGGQLYCNRYEDALIAFVVNLGLFWAAHDAFDQEQYALGSLLSFVGAGFYAGNIYGAVGDAHKFNRLQKQKFGDTLKRHIVISVGPSPPSTSGGLLFSLHVPF